MWESKAYNGSSTSWTDNSSCSFLQHIEIFNNGCAENWSFNITIGATCRIPRKLSLYQLLVAYDTFSFRYFIYLIDTDHYLGRPSFHPVCDVILNGSSPRLVIVGYNGSYNTVQSLSPHDIHTHIYTSVRLYILYTYNI